MLFNSALVVLAASLPLALAAPAEAIVHAKPLLRLVKTSEEDPGQWVTEEQKWDLFTSKNIGFFDITDIQDEEVLTRLSTRDTGDSLSRRAVTYPTSMQHVTEANSFISQASNTNPQSWLLTLTNFNNRHYRSTTGTEASTWIFNTVTSLAASNSAITISRVTHSFNQPSVIVKIPGNSTDLVIVGAHFDSIGGSSSARAPGADDNGSGVVNLLETLRIIAASGFKPKNTLEFHFYAGEEGGLLGSQAIFSSYSSQAKTVLAFLNQDMTGYSPSGRVSIYTDYVDSSLTSFVRLVATQYTGLTPTSDACGYGCSDHASARAYGFPAAYACDEVMATSSPYIHSSADAYSTIMWDAILRHTKLTIGFVVEASYI